MSARYKAHIALIFTLLIWGFASVVIKFTLDGISTMPFLTYRFFLSTSIAIPFLPKVIKLLKGPNIGSAILYSILVSPVALGILFFGLEKTSVVNLSIMAALSPLLLTYLGSHLFHDHLTKRAKFGVLIALFGTLVTIVEPLLNNYDGGTLQGNILLFAYILADIAGLVILKKLLKKKVNATSLTHLSFIVGFVSFLVLTIFTTGIPHLINEVILLPIKYHLGVWYMAIFSGTIAFIVRAKAQKTLTLSETSIYGYVSPVISTILAISLLGEKISLSFIVGSIFIAIGVILVEYKKKHK